MKTSVDTSEFKKLARDFLEAMPAVELAVMKSLLASAELVRRDAVARVGSWASSGARTKPGRSGARVAQSIRVRVTGPTTVKVEAGGADAPEAAPIENRGRGYVTHPTFGHRDRMTNKNSHPAFLTPASEARRPVTEASIEEAGVEAVKRQIHGR